MFHIRVPVCFLSSLATDLLLKSSLSNHCPFSRARLWHHLSLPFFRHGTKAISSPQSLASPSSRKVLTDFFVFSPRLPQPMVGTFPAIEGSLLLASRILYLFPRCGRVSFFHCGRLWITEVESQSLLITDVFPLSTLACQGILSFSAHLRGRKKSSAAEDSPLFGSRRTPLFHSPLIKALLLNWHNRPPSLFLRLPSLFECMSLPLHLLLYNGRSIRFLKGTPLAASANYCLTFFFRNASQPHTFSPRTIASSRRLPPFRFSFVKRPLRASSRIRLLSFLPLPLEDVFFSRCAPPRCHSLSSSSKCLKRFLPKRGGISFADL